VHNICLLLFFIIFLKARVSWDKQKFELEEKVKQLQGQLNESQTLLKKSTTSHHKVLSAKEVELSKTIKLKRAAENKLEAYEAQHVKNKDGLKLNDALRALGTLRTQCQEYKDKHELAQATISTLESQLADMVSELAQQKSKTALLEEKLLSTSGMQDKLEKAVADATAARVKLAEVTVQLSDAHKQSRQFAADVFDDDNQHEDDEEGGVNQTFAMQFGNDSEGKHDSPDEGNDTSDDEDGDHRVGERVGGDGCKANKSQDYMYAFSGKGRQISKLEKKLRESEYLVEALRNQLADVHTANHHAPMSELHALANCEDIGDYSRSELENLLDQARRECAEACYRADKESTIALDMQTQRNQLSLSLSEVTRSLNEVLAAQDSYRVKEVNAAVAAKRLKQLMMDATEQVAMHRTAQEKAEERKRATEEVRGGLCEQDIFHMCEIKFDCVVFSSSLSFSHTLLFFFFSLSLGLSIFCVV
jgi:chromosome segregation ATPase